KTVSNIEDYYSLVDVMVNSRRDAEPFGLTVVEAMLMMKPLIALKLGGPSETIIDGVTGWLIEESTPEAYFLGMVAAFEKRNQWSQIGKNGRKHALNNFTSEIFYDNLLTILNNIQHS